MIYRTISSMFVLILSVILKECQLVEREPWVFKDNLNKNQKYHDTDGELKYKDCFGAGHRWAFGQTGEDLNIYNRFFKANKYMGNGFFVEMGGLDGLTFSNSFLFEQCLGWKGML